MRRSTASEGAAALMLIGIALWLCAGWFLEIVHNGQVDHWLAGVALACVFVALPLSVYGAGGKDS